MQRSTLLLGAIACAASLALPAFAAPASGPGSIDGVWISMRFGTRTDPAADGAASGPGSLDRNRERAAAPLQPWAAKVQSDRAQDALDGRPHADPKSRCLPAGTPGSMLPPASLPLQIIESADQITVLFEEFNVFRIIRKADRHLPDPDPGYFGDSIARWEGDTLVIDTVGLNDQTTIQGAPHTEKLHVVERIRRNGDLLEMETTYEDPGAFTRVWSSKGSLKRVPGLRIQEYFCENDRNTPDADGKSGVQLSSVD